MNSGIRSLQSLLRSLSLAVIHHHLMMMMIHTTTGSGVARESRCRRMRTWWSQTWPVKDICNRHQIHHTVHMSPRPWRDVLQMSHCHHTISDQIGMTTISAWPPPGDQHHPTEIMAAERTVESIVGVAGLLSEALEIEPNVWCNFGAYDSPLNMFKT